MMEKKCVLSENYHNITGATFQINNAKLYVSFGTSDINDEYE